MIGLSVHFLRGRPLSLPMQAAPLQTAGTYMVASSLQFLRLHTTVIRHPSETPSVDVLNGTQVAVSCQGSAIAPAKVRYIDRRITQASPC
jgi:hypothetical protein